MPDKNDVIVRRDESHFALTADCLEERIAGRVYTYGRWDREFGAWRSTGPLERNQFFPNWPLVNKAGNSILGEERIPIYDDVPDERDVSGTRDIIHPYAGIYHLCSLSRNAFFEALNDFIDLIPVSVRQILGEAGWCQWLLCDAIRIRPGIQGFLEHLVGSGEIGFMRACFILSRYWAMDTTERATLLDFISCDEPRNIIHAPAQQISAHENSESHLAVERALRNCLLSAYADGKEHEIFEIAREAPHLTDLAFRLGLRLAGHLTNDGQNIEGSKGKG